MGKMIEFKHVKRAYGVAEKKFYALKDLSFKIEEGEFVVILGPSGAGKSTLLNLLGGMDRVSEGTIVVDGRAIQDYADNELTQFRAEQIGFVFQFYNLIPSLTALENVAITKDICKRPLEAKKTLESVGLSNHFHQFPNQLSGGEQQRVSIARAIAKNSKLLLCDEPTGALDSETGIQILQLLHDLCKIDGKTVIIVTHNALIAQIADRVIHLRNGDIHSIAMNNTPIAIDEVSW